MKCKICKKENTPLSNKNECIKCWVRLYAWKWNIKDIKKELKELS